MLRDAARSIGGVNGRKNLPFTVARAGRAFMASIVQTSAAEDAMHISISPKTIAAHVLRTLAAAQGNGEKLTLDALTTRLSIRRTDVRSTLTALHREGHIDVLRMRLTLSGYALGTALLEVAPAALRRVAQRAAA